MYNSPDIIPNPVTRLVLRSPLRTLWTKNSYFRVAGEQEQELGEQVFKRTDLASKIRWVYTSITQLGEAQAQT